MLELGFLRRHHAALAIQLDAMLLEPRCRARAEAEGDDHGVGRQDLFGAWDRLGATTATGIRLTQAGLDNLHAFDLVLADDGDGLAVVEELHAFFLGVLHLFARTRHVGFVTAIGAGHRLGALADRRAVAVHRGVATAEHHHLLALHIDEVFRRLLEAEVTVDVGDQEVQRIVDAWQIFTRETTLHVGVGAHAHEHGVVFGEQLFHGDVLAHLGVQAELDAHAGKDFAAIAQHGLFQLELRDAEGQQATDLRVLVEHHRGHATAHQHVGAAQTSRAGTNDGDALAGWLDLGHVRAPAHGKCRVGDVFLHRADGHSAEPIIQGAGPLAQTVLRANTAAHFRQGVGLVRQFGRGQDVAFGDQLQPVGDEVVYRTLPLAIRVAAAQATVRLLHGLLRLERFVDFHELLLALAQQLLLGVLAAHFDELEVVVQTFSHFSKPLYRSCQPQAASCKTIT